jgi:hypothetical protein
VFRYERDCHVLTGEFLFCFVFGITTSKAV